MDEQHECLRRATGSRFRVNVTAHANRGQPWSQLRAANTAEALSLIGKQLHRMSSARTSGR